MTEQSASLVEALEDARESFSQIEAAYTWNSSTFQCLNHAQQVAKAARHRLTEALTAHPAAELEN